MTKNVFGQKSSNLCVPISVATLLRFAIKNDLDFEDDDGDFSAEKILAILTMVVYPRSMAGLNLNPKKEETDFQFNEIELLLERLCKETYLMPTGWQIIRQIGQDEEFRPKKSICKFEKGKIKSDICQLFYLTIFKQRFSNLIFVKNYFSKNSVLLNENFTFTRPLTVTGAYLHPAEYIDGDFFPEEVLFHQMVLDRIDNPTDYDKAEYILHNTSFAQGGPLLKIPKTRAYYVNEFMMQNNQTGRNEFKFYGQNGEFMWLVNEKFRNMQPKTWYLLPQAYSITLLPEKAAVGQVISF